jgi:hypothetical protein
MLIGVILVPILLVLSRGKPAAIFPPWALGDKPEQPQLKKSSPQRMSDGSLPDNGHHQTRIRRMTRRF